MTYLIILLFLIFAVKRSLTYLHIFQQEEYNGKRFLTWIVNSLTFDRLLSCSIFIITIFQIIIADRFIINIVLGLTFIFFTIIEKNPNSYAKKKLVITKRVWRILVIAIILDAIFAGIILAISHFAIVWLILVQLLPIMLVLANIILIPFENFNQKKYWDEAHSKLLKYKPFVIAITGSFGKTSVKHILGHILDLSTNALMTPGSVNTPMGIARIIREKLKPEHKFFIVEMGAYGPGSIERLCKLTPPNMAIITTIGHAHYERFKSLDTVCRAKFELATATIKNRGKVITTTDVLKFNYPQKFYARHRNNFIICDLNNTPDNYPLTLKKTEQTTKGLTIDLIWNKKPYSLKLPIFGSEHGKNAALALACAATLNIDCEKIITALTTIAQIPHRLEVKIHPGNPTLIDDAYNSNPKGFVSALELLNILKKPNGKTILATPGMVELGKTHHNAHAKIGKIAAKYVDILIAIVPDRIPSLIESFKKEKNTSQKIILCENFAKAKKWLDINSHPDDIILLENDLPDLYELKLNL